MENTVMLRVIIGHMLYDIYIPILIRSSKSVASFKTQLKTHFFKTRYHNM